MTDGETEASRTGGGGTHRPSPPSRCTTPARTARRALEGGAPRGPKGSAKRRRSGATRRRSAIRPCQNPTKTVLHRCRQTAAVSHAIGATSCLRWSTYSRLRSVRYAAADNEPGSSGCGAVPMVGATHVPLPHGVGDPGSLAFSMTIQLGILLALLCAVVSNL